MDSNSIVTPTLESLEMVRSISKEIQTFHHHYHILYDIAEQFYPHGCNFLEIGTFKGASAVLMLQRPNTNVVTVDSGKYVKRDEVLSDILNRNPCENNLWYFELDSHKVGTRDSIEMVMPEVDILFLDGDHSQNGVFVDFCIYKKLMAKGGFVVFDDYNDREHNPQVKEVVDIIVNTIEPNEFEIIGSLPSTFNATPIQDDGICFIIRKL